MSTQQLRLLDTVTRSVRAGDRVTCAYRGDHHGTVLSVYEPSAWEDTVAFPGRLPSAADVRAHVQSFMRPGAKDPASWPTRCAPVLWDFGKVLWDRVDALRLAQQKGSP